MVVVWRSDDGVSAKSGSTNETTPGDDLEIEYSGVSVRKDMIFDYDGVFWCNVFFFYPLDSIL